MRRACGANVILYFSTLKPIYGYMYEYDTSHPTPMNTLKIFLIPVVLEFCVYLKNSISTFYQYEYIDLIWLTRDQLWDKWFSPTKFKSNLV